MHLACTECPKTAFQVSGGRCGLLSLVDDKSPWARAAASAAATSSWLRAQPWVLRDFDFYFHIEAMHRTATTHAALSGQCTDCQPKRQALHSMKPCFSQTCRALFLNSNPNPNPYPYRS